MTVSVRMDTLLERELEQAAQRRGVSKSQFIIDAVQRALGHKDPGQLLLQVREEFAPMRAAEAAAGGPLLPESTHAERVRAVLRAKHQAALAEWQPLGSQDTPSLKLGQRKPAKRAAAAATPARKGRGS